MDRVNTQRWNENEFFALSDEEAFLLQVLHACHHFFTLWIRMSCLYEIAYFLNRRANDSKLWDRVEEHVGDSSVLREFVVVVSQTAASLFGTPVPPLISRWTEQIRIGPRIWVDKYCAAGLSVKCQPTNSAYFRLPSLPCFFTSSIGTTERQTVYRSTTRSHAPCGWHASSRL